MTVNTIVSPSRRPKERLISGRGWGSFFFVSALVVAVTWFVIHLPV